MRIIDFHTHAFPDGLAERAVPRLAEGAGVQPLLDGKVSSLLRSMDDAGIDASVVASIATKPEQFEPILEWSKSIASDRIIPFPSLHPADPLALERVGRVRDEGFRGLKLHPYYQEFDLDEERVLPLYERIRECGLVLLSHTGFDVAFPRVRRCEPARVRRVLEALPGLRLVTSHIGAWQDWGAVREHLLGEPIYMETSYSVQFMSREEARGLLAGHPRDYVLFGTDSPWAGQKEAIGMLRSLGLEREREEAILGGNAERLLGLR